MSTASLGDAQQRSGRRSTGARNFKPAWLLESERQLAELTVRQEEAAAKLRELRASLESFDQLLLERRPLVATSSKEAPAAARGLEARLPTEIVRKVYSFCDANAMVAYGRVAASARRWLGEHDEVWALEGLDRPWFAALLRSARTKREAATRYASLVETARGSVESTSRADALLALRAAALVTADASSNTCRDLCDRGSATRLVALLEDELGAVQELSAAVLANLLACRACQPRLLSDLARCHARRALVALLTSPSARITLSVARDTQASAYCHGMGCKHASRALVNLFLPDLALALPPTHPSSAAVCSDQFVLDVRSYYASGSFKDRSRLSLHIHDAPPSEPSRYVSGSGRDDMGDFVLEGCLESVRRATNIAGGPTLHLRKHYVALDDAHYLANSQGHVALVLWAGLRPDCDGWFGVWELADGEARFQLRRGGCCRAAPYLATDGRRLVDDL